MSARFLALELIAAMQRQTIEEFGGSHGLRDRNLLESAAARAETLEFYRPGASIGELAATLAWGHIKNHAFIDGNKRIGLICLVIFLRVNGCRLTSSQQEETTMVMRVASGDITEEGWTQWVVGAVVPIA